MILKKNVFFVAIFLCINIIIWPTIAMELDETTRTVQLNDIGKTLTLTPEQVKRGKRLFNNACAQCHNGGITKTNPNIGLDIEALSLATPQRDNLNSLVDYMKNPTSYDGTNDISEVHPSIISADIFPKMKNLTDDDLASVAGYILTQSQLFPDKWGGGKIYY